MIYLLLSVTLILLINLMYDRRTYLGTNIRDIGNRILDMVIKIRSQTLNKNNYENVSRTKRIIKTGTTTKSATIISS